MNIFDLTDARLLAEVRTKKWIEEFEIEYNKPVIEMMVAQTWQALPSMVKDEIAKRAPRETKNMNKKYGGV